MITFDQEENHWNNDNKKKKDISMARINTIKRKQKTSLLVNEFL